MKKKTIGRIAVFTFALCMISISLLSGTLAKYASNVEGEGTVNVAQWSNIQFQGEAKTEDFSFNLAGTKADNDLVKSDQIAPGDKGSFTFTVGPAEVAYSYTATIAGDVPVTFYSDAAMTEPWSAAAKEVTAANAVGSITETVYWQWTPGTDSVDTAKGIANGSPKFTITLHAEQTLATPEP